MILLTVVVTILIFLMLISLHEFGHFIMAKLSGVGVLEFAIGMGPAILKKQKGETLYSIRAFPIGGYCRLEGEDEDCDSEKAFGKQKIWKRFLVISAGAILNILLGFFIFIIFTCMQGSIATNEIASIDERAYIQESGIVAGDKIVGINSHRVTFYDDIRYYLDKADMNEDIEIKVKRNGEKLVFNVKPSKEEQRAIYDKDGATVISNINGVTKESYVAYTDEQKALYRDYSGKEITSQRYIIGFSAKSEPVTIKNVFTQSYRYTSFVVKIVFDALGDLFTGKTGIDDFSGPVGVATAVNSAVTAKAYNVEALLNLIAMLTINLGIFNLLPLPALDGGRLFFLLIELIIGKPVPPEKEGIVHTIGIILLLGLAVVVLFNDILKLF